ncbi:hypothetical protein IE81DRAFT_346324 [Ceraceosorus guamensis]|uniref:UBL3-like ubiquitin domain-containing protein n=1 Tax=Ceraceosorus guamensis TaxID=1522189 RepID=A0A316W2K5_9BASI|nr:hypothetical protein IE81DRAFT_346324 [Ceraceosorus guamensis]PWN43724.1 hypothetical protein IE81DRAFT_346324 [Ceraceosorus guamensis]
MSTQVEANLAANATSPSEIGMASSSNAGPSGAVDASTAASTSSRVRSALIAKDKVRIDALLTSGQRHLFDFEPSTLVSEARDQIWNEWPADFPLRPAEPSALRMLHLGHILDDRAPLSGDSPAAGGRPATGGMPLGKVTVVHILIRQPVKDSNADDESLKKDDVQAGCRCVIC